MFRRLIRSILAAAVVFGGVLAAVPTAQAAAVPLTLEYDKDFSVLNINSQYIYAAPADAFGALHECFNCIFPVQGAPSTFPTEGEYLPLQVCGLAGIIVCKSAAVRSYARPDDNYIEYVAQAGHFDGAGSTVSFMFYSDSSGRLHLHVVAYISPNPSINPAITKPAALATWAQYAVNMGTWLWRNDGCNLQATPTTAHCAPRPSTWPQETAASCSSMSAIVCTGGNATVLDTSCPGGTQQWFDNTDLNNVAIHYTYSDDARACMRVHYNVTPTSQACTFWFYVPKKWATGNIVFGIWNTANVKTYFWIDENNVDGWQPLFNASNITHIEWQDNDGVATNTRYLGWSSDSQHGLAEVC